MPFKLDVGSGKKRVDGFKTLDKFPDSGADFICDAWNTPIKSGDVTEIRSRHFLEHLTIKQMRQTLMEWHRILTPDGKIWVMVPNLLYHCKQIFEPGHSEYMPQEINFDHAMASIFGWPSDNPFMGHKWGYTPHSLKMEFIAFDNIELPATERACDLVITCTNYKQAKPAVKKESRF